MEPQSSFPALLASYETIFNSSALAPPPDSPTNVPSFFPERDDSSAKPERQGTREKENALPNSRREPQQKSRPIEQAALFSPGPSYIFAESESSFRISPPQGLFQTASALPQPSPPFNASATRLNHASAVSPSHIPRPANVHTSVENTPTSSRLQKNSPAVRQPQNEHMRNPGLSTTLSNSLSRTPPTKFDARTNGATSPMHTRQRKSPNQIGSEGRSYAQLRSSPAKGHSNQNARLASTTPSFVPPHPYVSKEALRKSDVSLRKTEEQNTAVKDFSYSRPNADEMLFGTDDSSILQSDNQIPVASSHQNTDIADIYQKISDLQGLFQDTIKGVSHQLQSQVDLTSKDLATSYDELRSQYQSLAEKQRGLLDQQTRQRKDHTQSLSDLEEKFDQKINKMREDFQGMLEASFQAFLERLNDTIEKKIQTATDENRKFLQDQFLYATKEGGSSREKSTGLDVYPEAILKLSEMQTVLVERLSHTERAQHQMQENVQVLTEQLSQFMSKKDEKPGETNWFSNGSQVQMDHKSMQSQGRNAYETETRTPGDDISLPFDVYRKRLEKDLTESTQVAPSTNQIGISSFGRGSWKSSSTSDLNTANKGKGQLDNYSSISTAYPVSQAPGGHIKKPPKPTGFARTPLMKQNGDELDSNFSMESEELSNHRNQSYFSSALQLSELENPKYDQTLQEPTNATYQTDFITTESIGPDSLTQGFSDNRVRFLDLRSENVAATPLSFQRPTMQPATGKGTNPSRLVESIPRSNGVHSSSIEPSSKPKTLYERVDTELDASRLFDLGSGAVETLSWGNHASDRKREHSVSADSSREAYQKAQELCRDVERLGLSHQERNREASSERTLLTESSAVREVDDLDATLDLLSNSVVFDFITRLAK